MSDGITFIGEASEQLALARLQEMGIKPVRVLIKKLAVVENPEVPTPDVKDYIPGGGDRNGEVSIPVDFTAEGYLVKEPKEGDVLWILRTKRNDVEVAGDLMTSNVQSISEEGGAKMLRTRNSVYILSYLDQN